jgi:ATP-dependent metalloprotease FtsH
MPKFSIKKHTPFLTLLLLIALSLIAYYKQHIDVIDLPTYKSFLEKGLFTSATIEDRNVILTTDEGTYSIILDGVDIERLLDSVPVAIASSENYIEAVVTFLLFFMLLFALITFGKREKKEEKTSQEMQGSLAQVDQHFYKKVAPTTSAITFKDVAGIESVKSELTEVVDFLKRPQKYKEFGIKLPRGVLLVGPPGVGKTLIAKAVAGEAGVPFFYQSGASFVQIYVGMGAKRVRELFASAKSMAPAIIFIDEIDAVGRSRGGAGRNDERDATLNQLLTEMDGFEDSSNVIVIAATNQIDILDEALLRAGRFDRRVFITLPNISERRDILKVHLEGKPHSIKYIDIAKMTVGFSGAALATLVNEAAIYALNQKAKKITKSHFLAVKDKVLLGKRKVLSYSDDEKQIQATYQAAKALSAYWYEIDFDKVSILGDSYKGVEREIESRSQMMAKIKLYLSGLVATNIFYDETFSNAREDVARAKQLSMEMVERYAMGEGILPTQMDSATILDEAIEDVETFLYKMKDAVKAIANVLLEEESISKEKLKGMVDALL